MGERMPPSPRRSLATLALLSLVLGACGATVDGNDGKKRDLGGPKPDGHIDFVDMARDTTSCAGGGTACSSGNPGACDPGTVTCSGTLAMCTPDSTVQDCYEGPLGTAGVGICASGAQSCIGVVGACQGQVLPKALEDCSNDLDDDCNGTVNNGCPESIGIGTPRLVPPYVGANGNANAKDLNVRCPTDAFVSGVVIEFMDAQFQVAALRLSCAKATLSRSGAGYALSTQPITPSPYVSLIADAPARGTGTPITAACAGLGLRALFAARGSYDVQSNLGGITGFLTKCGVATASLNTANNTMSFMVAETGNEIGYDYGVLLSSEVAVNWGSCAATEVLIGFNGRVSTCGQAEAGPPPIPGACLDKLQPVCAALVPKYKP